MSVVAGIVESLLDIGKRFIPDPKAQSDFEIEVMKIQQNAILAEANSTDKWTSRARPSFMYVMYVMILSCIPMGILYAINPLIAHNIEAGMQGWLSALPKPMWDLFTMGYLGYSALRTHEKQPFFGGK